MAWPRTVTAAAETVTKVRRDPGAAAGVAVARVAAAQSAVEGLRDARRLHREHPRLVPGTTGQEALRSRHARYVSDVSSADMAVSWQTALYLWHLCGAAEPERILDLGSGFSSYVLRHHAAATGRDVTVVSVDDSEAWLERTRQFLADNALVTGELRTWSDFAAEPGEPFDLIFHDLAGGELRETAMSVAVRALSPRGLIVFDDAHHPGHRRAARRVAGEGGLATYSLYRWTHDAYGRFAMLGSP